MLVRDSVKHPQMWKLSLQPGDSLRCDSSVGQFQLPEAVECGKVGQSGIADLGMMQPERFQFPQRFELCQPGIGDPSVIQGQKLKLRERPQMVEARVGNLR